MIYILYFTSDTHFGAERTRKLSKRPFKTVPEMDEVLINNWNSTVSQNDIVYHLGDFGDLNYASQLNGNIVLVGGNYEWKLTQKRAKQYGFVSFIPYTKENKLFLDEYTISMTHRPHDLRDRHIDDHTINLFGHLHKTQMVKRYGLNVSSDCHNFTPIGMEDILFYHDAILHYYDNEVFE